MITSLPAIVPKLFKKINCCLPEHKNRSAGFTLVEIVVATAVSIVLMGVVYNLLFSTLNADKVSEEFTNSVFEARRVVLRISQEMLSARDLIYPSVTSRDRVYSSDFIVFKDAMNLIKAVYYDTVKQEVKLFSVKIDKDTGKLLLESDPKALGRNISGIRFTCDGAHPEHIQFRIYSRSGEQEYHLVSGVRMLNG
jgi:competence protein ComGC